MSATPPDMQRSSRRRRIWNAISALLCRPTRPPSLAQATGDLSPGPEPRPNAISESTPPTGLVADHLVPASSAQERPVEGSAAQSLSSPEPHEDVPVSNHEGTTAALALTSISSTHTLEGPVAVVSPSHSPTPQPCSTLASAHDTSASVTPAVADAEDFDLPVAKSESSLRKEPEETQGQLYLTNVIVTRNVASDEITVPLHLTLLCPLGVGGSQEGQCIPLDENSLQSWTLNGCIALTLGACGIYCVVKDEEGHNVGFIYLNQEDLQMSGDNVRPFVTHDSQLSLFMSWKVADNVAQSPGGDLLPSRAILDPGLRSSINQQECLAIGTYYKDEGVRLARRFMSTGNLDDINGSIFALQRAIEIAQAKGHIELPSMLSNLAESLESRFKHTGNIPDVTEAIAIHQAAIQLTPEGHGDLPPMLSHLGNSLRSRFLCTGDMSDITEAIVAQQTAVQLTPEGHASLPSWLCNLGGSFQTRFGRTGNMSDIIEAIDTLQAAIRLTSGGHADLRLLIMNSLGASFQSRFQHTGDMTDITEAIAAFQAAVQLTPEGHAGLPIHLSNLGTSFQTRFEHTGDLSDITEAITVQQTAVRLTPKGHANLPIWLNNLGNSIQSRFDHTGDMSDITEAIAAQKTAVQLTPEGHVNLPSMLTNLGVSLQSRFEHTGDLSDIAEAIAANQAAVRLTPEGHANLVIIYNSLGVSFQSRFEHTGDMSDITEAIAAKQTALQLTPEGHPGLAAMHNNLGVAFQSRFERTGDMSDITEAIAANQAAVRLTPEGHASLSFRLSNLGRSFQSHFERTGELSDITEAIAAQQTAVRLTPTGHASLPFRLSSLGRSFQSRFEHTRDMPDIMEAIATQQAAVQLTPEGHTELPFMLNNLGNSFQSLFIHTRDVLDIIEAINTHQAAVRLTPGSHADLPLRLSDLGNSFLHRFEHVKSMDDMQSSLECWRAVTEVSTGAPTVRLRCALSWARLINHYNPESLDVLVPFKTAVHLLTLVAGLERTLQGRHSQLQDVSGTALEAAAAACRLGQHAQAVEWLEQGRCLVWGQLNGLRTPMDNLREQDSRLAQRLADVAEQLELAGSTRTAIQPSMEISAKISLEEEARSHSALAREWEELLLAARNLPGFKSSLLPTPCSALLEGLPESGPIIIINTHQDRCDALALLDGSDQPLHILLPDFSLEKAKQYQRVLKDVLRSNGIRMRQSTGSCGELEGRAIIQGWPDNTKPYHTVNWVLRSLWLEVAKPVMDMLGYSRTSCTSPDSVPPRLWWCPTGVMSFLPIHAAGIYGGTDSECVMDYVVSSYTPTVTAITDRVKSSSLIDITASGLFLTSQPKAPGAAEIAGTTREVEGVHLKAVSKGVRTLKCEGDDVSVEDCRKYMGEFSSVHLACHASQNASDPLQSRFLLHKGELSLLSIIQMNLKNADLAFLSACQTSSGEEKLSEEAVHLAAGMLAAGYRRVVATMWSIGDAHAPKVATDFYDYLWNRRVDGAGEGFDGALSAHALHHAVQQLRRRLGNSERDLLTWIPYVHFGY